MLMTSIMLGSSLVRQSNLWLEFDRRWCHFSCQRGAGFDRTGYRYACIPFPVSLTQGTSEVQHASVVKDMVTLKSVAIL